MIIEEIVEKISVTNPIQGKKLSGYLATQDERFFEKANAFLLRYEALLKHLNKDIDFGVDCYNNMIADMVVERLQFLSTGNYSNTSFEAVNKSLYNKPESFEHHMHGLFLAQFLWVDQYERFKFFSENIIKVKPEIQHYLEIGAGHGLYILEATNQLKGCEFGLVDISPVSLEMCEVVLKDKPITFINDDIFKVEPTHKYDFITIGEVVEHLENPHQMLKRLHHFLKDDGVIYITTPANAPMIDHIYLFHNSDEIRNFINDCGFEIISERLIYAENTNEEKAIKYKLPLMFAAFIKKK